MDIANKPFFYFEPLKLWEKWTIFIYASITLGLYFLYNSVDTDSKGDILFIYPFASQFFIYFFLYISLRNLLSYLIWLSFGIIHFIVYLGTKNDVFPYVINGHEWLLRNTVALLLLFQLLRFVSLKLQFREFVLPSKGGDTGLFEHVKISLLDKILFVIFMAFCGILGYFAFNNF